MLKNEISKFILLWLKIIFQLFQGQNSDWLTVEYNSPNPSVDDWIGVFSPSNFR